jgi:hypothetical protein
MVAQLYHSCFAFPRIQSSSQGHRLPFPVYYVDVKGTSSKGEGEHPNHIPRISFCIEDKWHDPFPFHPFYGQVLSVFDWQPVVSTGSLSRWCKGKHQLHGLDPLLSIENISISHNKGV